MKFWDVFSRDKSKGGIPPDMQLWNKFISVLTSNEPEDLDEKLIPAMLVFWYDAEVNSSGHSGYFELYPNVAPEALINALEIVGASAFIDNYKMAVMCGEEHDCIEVDRCFGEINPTLTRVLIKYVVSNAEALGLT